MKIILLSLVANLASILCVGIAGYALIEGKEGWDWFLFIGWAVSASVSMKSGDKKTKKEK